MTGGERKGKKVMSQTQQTQADDDNKNRLRVAYAVVTRQPGIVGWDWATVRKGGEREREREEG